MFTGKLGMQDAKGKDLWENQDLWASIQESISANKENLQKEVYMEDFALGESIGVKGYLLIIRKLKKEGYKVSYALKDGGLRWLLIKWR